jgi:hypothetical protein
VRDSLHPEHELLGMRLWAGRRLAAVSVRTPMGMPSVSYNGRTDRGGHCTP